MGTMQERITTTKKGSITSVQAIYVPADDLTDPAPATTFAHLDATTVLSRGVAERGIYPAVDPLDSTSRIMDPNVIGAEHYGVARDVQKLLQDYKSLQDIIAILGGKYDHLPEGAFYMVGNVDEVVAKGEKLLAEALILTNCSAVPARAHLDETFGV